jgi:hypothetical protein
LLYVAASMEKQGERIRHNTGVYFQDIPTDPIDGCASILSDNASNNGYFKVDFLPLTLYSDVRSEDHLIELINEPVMWEMFEHRDIVGMLTHIHSSFGIVQAIKPKSIDDLAVILGLMRPGKRHLLGQPREVIDTEIWKPGSDGFVFKRAHAYAYAVTIVVNLNLICEQMAAKLAAGEALVEEDVAPEMDHEIFR